MARVALIDGDSFAYRLAAAVEKTLYLVSETKDGNLFQEYATHKAAVAAAAEVSTIYSTKKVGTLKEAVDLLEAKIERSIARAQCTVFHVYIGGSGPTFRDHLARIRKYKGQRFGLPPTYLPDLRNYLNKQWGAVVSSGEEADDMLSYTARELAASGVNTPVVIGNDKDLDQIPGEHYDWVSDKLYIVSDAEARIRMWVQVLHGDVADNIAGCWKVGAKGADKTIREAIEDWGLDDNDLWKFVCTAYEESQEYPGCPYVNLDPTEVALENYNLVRLRQSRHEKHEYRGLYVPEKKKERSVSIAGDQELSTSTSSRESPLACAASEKACFGQTQSHANSSGESGEERGTKVPEPARRADSTGLAKEESDL